MHTFNANPHHTIVHKYIQA